jgi:thioesterase domain-containing protein
MSAEEDRAAALAERRAKLPAAQRSLLEERLRLHGQQGGAVAAAPASLVAIQPRGDRPALFCVHPAGGDVLCFSALSRHLGADQPFYGLQSRGLAAGEEPLATIAAMAAAYRDEIVRAAAGPYHLAGWSLGGAVAFEVARQLAAAGEEVALLAIVDGTPGTWPRLPSGDGDGGAGDGGAGEGSEGEGGEGEGEAGGEAEDGGGHAEDGGGEADDARWLMDIADYLERLWGVDCGLSYDELAALPAAAQATRFLAALRDTPFGAAGSAGAEPLGRLLRVFKTNVRAFRRYRPAPYPGPITLFRPTAAAGAPEDAAATAAAAADPLLGWGALTPRPVAIERVPGDHISALAEPHVRTLAERLRACIEQAAERRP